MFPRQRVLKTLSAFASRIELMHLADSLTQDSNVAKHLFDTWSNDSYHPNDEKFINNFSPDELQQLKYFTVFFAHKLESFPGKFEDLIWDNTWHKLCAYAEKLISSFNGDPQQKVMN